MSDAIKQHVERLWEDEVLPGLSDFIKIPAVSPAYDESWESNGYLRQAGELMAAWAKEQNIVGLKSEIVQIEKRSPVLFVEIPGSCERTVLFYGHLDKMPAAEGWDEGLGPWTPVIKNDRLFGRGGVDDGYAFYSALTAIKSLQLENIDHPRCVLLIEACEESGSFDLAAYLEQMRGRIGNPSLIFCLDTCSQDYERLWITSSLRGVFSFDLRIKELEKPVHPGVGGGIIPDISRVLRLILNRIDDVNTGRLLIDSCNVEIPAKRVADLRQAADVLQDKVYQNIPLAAGVEPVSHDITELLTNKTWRPAMSILGISGFPEIAKTTLVMIPEITLRGSVRIPPTSNVDSCIKEIRDKLTAEPPFGVSIEFTMGEGVSGWASPPITAELTAAISDASKAYFGNDAIYLGEGGGIGFVSMINNMFPKAQLVVTGVIGPDSHVHGANEAMHIPTAKRLTCCLAHILQAYCQD